MKMNTFAIYHVIYNIEFHASRFILKTWIKIALWNQDKEILERVCVKYDFDIQMFLSI